MAASKPHWGQWVLRRSRIVGYQTQLDLARKVGVSRQHLAKWISKSHPMPMRRRLDVALAKALKIDRQTLFEEWQMVEPEKAPQVDVGETGDVPWAWVDPAEEVKRRDIRLMCDMLHAEDLDAALIFVAERWKRIASDLDVRLRTAIMGKVENQVYSRRVNEELDRLLSDTRSKAKR